MRDSDPSGKLADYKWPADELARFNAYMASTEPLWHPSDPPERMPAPDIASKVEHDVPPVDLGHNGPPPDPFSDPGPDREFQFAFQVPEHVNTKAFMQDL